MGVARAALLAVIGVPTLLGACGGPEAGSDAAAIAVTDGWLGRWSGPEGTFLLLEGGEGRYRVTVQNLDGPRTFDGIAVGDRIQFVRDGIVESVSATNGADTGMKWLRDKANCLTVRFGEGYCRD